MPAAKRAALQALRPGSVVVLCRHRMSSASIGGSGAAHVVALPLLGRVGGFHLQVCAPQNLVEGFKARGARQGVQAL